MTKDEVEAIIRACRPDLVEDEPEWYMVAVEGKQSPGKRHGTYEAAEAEAKRLAILEGRTAYVVQPVAEVTVETAVRRLK